jgi:hypothetical protein
VVPRDPYAHSVVNAAEYGKDTHRMRYFHDLMAGTPQQITTIEPLDAANDPTQAPRVYAPAWERIQKQAMPWDAEVLAAGRSHTITAESALHPGDRSHPAEVR